MILCHTQNKDIEKVLEIFSQAKNSLRERGVNQWQEGYPNEESLLFDIQSNTSYVVKELFGTKQSVIATAAIICGIEPTYNKIYEGSWKTCGNNYVAVHRIAVADDVKRMGAASFILSQAVKIAENDNRISIRIDTHRDNIPMRTMLQKNGYEYCGIIYLPSDYSSSTERLAYEYIIK